MRIVVFLRNLDTGGAQRQLVQVMAGLAARGHEVHLVTPGAGGALAALLSPAVTRTTLGLEARGRAARALALARTPGRLRGALRALAPDVVYTALYANDALAHRALRGSGIPLVWGFRNVDQPLSWSRSLALRYVRRHAGEVALAIANCHSGARYLREAGFDLRALRVVPNGVDPEAFRPDPEAGARLRAELGLPRDAFVVGCVARLHPMKDHETFLAAAALLARQAPEARFLCVGSGAPAHAERLRRRARALGLEARVTWAGERADVRAVHNACDLVASTSLAEGFPNALVEAQACGRPCVASDVGDCKRALAPEGIVVPARDPDAQARAWRALRAEAPAARAARGERARARVVAELSLEACAAGTERALLEAAGRA